MRENRATEGGDRKEGADAAATGSQMHRQAGGESDPFDKQPKRETERMHESETERYLPIA